MPRCLRFTISRSQVVVGGKAIPSTNCARPARFFQFALTAQRSLTILLRIALGQSAKSRWNGFATASQKFHFFDRATSPHTGQNIIFFTVGPYTYCVSEETAQGSGIGLTVLKSGRKVVDLFSGNNRGVDFETRMMEVSFSSALSTVFQPFEPLKPFQTPCDPRPTK